MNAIFSILVVLIVIASILLTIVVLLQNGKGDSMASNFVAGNQTFGVRQTANMLEKVTWGLVTFILVVSIISSFTMGSKGTQVDITDQISNTATEQPAFPSAPVQQENPASEQE
ncbi:MAG: preprotein translocase subunit SecG [Candidatus Cryptobacteroides sp.]|nr:preprotein translocase subunit SecG [Bacteroidales bacterium]